MSTTFATNNKGESEIYPKVVPAAGEDLWTSDVHAVEIQLINKTSAAVTVTISDKQTAPQPIVPPTVSIQAYGDAIWEFSGRLCPGGIHWSAGADDSIVGYVRVRP